MRWRGGRRSDNIEDRRGSGPARGFGRGGFGRGLGGRGLPIGALVGRLGLGGTIALVAVLFLLGVDPRMLFGGGYSDEVAMTPAPPRVAEADRELADFVSVVLADTEDVWNGLFAKAGQDYPEPTLVLFTGAVESACGQAQAAIGPFYCPADRQVYIDLSFYAELRDRLDAPGDFAQAYVVAHEVGHHIQTVLGTSEQVRAAQQGLGEAESNALSVRLELQADCFAGLWAHHAQQQRQVLEPGDIEEALNAASAIGDDTLQRRAQGRVVPDSFTHGTSAQRMDWFRRGYETGRMEACDTFAQG